ncbi:MAG: molybdopterin-dependent oxidoreductase [Phycisphaerales bacterium]
MPTITIDGKVCEFTPGQTIIQVALANGIEIPHYCYHPGMSIVASCRICLAEVWAPNPRNDNKLEAIPKLVPTCQTQAGDGQVVYLDSPKTVQGQKGVMEYLLINHPLDCPVCDQAGECLLQDYSYQHGRSVSRFEEVKVKQPKKDLGPNVLLYADRCIMCTRCARFTREITGTNELIVQGRGNQEQIDIFPGMALDNDLASNVIDLCPVGALLDKDFLFAKRVWDLTVTPSIDGITASGDNITLEHASGKVYRVKPRTNMAVNKWWITDEVRYGWKFIHSDERIQRPLRRRFGEMVDVEWARALTELAEHARKAVEEGKRFAILISPMLASEEAYLLATAARKIDDDCIVGLGPVPVQGEDKVFPPGAGDDHPGRFVKRAEKAPNARGVRRVLEAVLGAKRVLAFDAFVKELGGKKVGAALLTGNYPSMWHTDALVKAAGREDLFLAVCDTLTSRLVDGAEVVLPSSTWAEKAGCFENAMNRIQAFEQAIEPLHESMPEGQIALDLLWVLAGDTTARRRLYNAANIRMEMADAHDALRVFTSEIHMPEQGAPREADMAVVEL